MLCLFCFVENVHMNLIVVLSQPCELAPPALSVYAKLIASWLQVHTKQTHMRFILLKNCQVMKPGFQSEFSVETLNGTLDKLDLHC